MYLVPVIRVTGICSVGELYSLQLLGAWYRSGAAPLVRQPAKIYSDR